MHSPHFHSPVPCMSGTQQMDTAPFYNCDFLDLSLSKFVQKQKKCILFTCKKVVLKVLYYSKLGFRKIESIIKENASDFEP